MGRYAIRNAVILDGTENMEPQYGKTIFIQDGKIEEIRVSQGQEPGYVSIDLDGQYVLPGLINLHVHIPSTGKPKKKPSDPKKLAALVMKNGLTRVLGYALCKKYLMPELWSGVTTLRTVGGLGDFDARLRDEIAAEKFPGPRIVASNMAISVPGGHMAGSVAYEAHSPEEAAELVRRIAETKPDLIKLMITGGVLDAKKRGEPGELKMPPEYVKAACDEAHKLGMHVAAHVESPEGVRVALENGVDTIEHGAEPNEKIMELFRERKACHVTTLSPALPFALFDREVSFATEVQQYNGKVLFEGIIHCTKACLEAGVPVGLGTDTGCPYITHYDMWREIYYFHKYCGVSNQFALYSATLGNAKILGLDKETGSIAPGKSADLIACRENPLEHVKALRNLTMVMAKGTLVDHTKLKKYENVERELDKFLD